MSVIKHIVFIIAAFLVETGLVRFLPRSWREENGDMIITIMAFLAVLIGVLV